MTMILIKPLDNINIWTKEMGFCSPELWASLSLSSENQVQPWSYKGSKLRACRRQERWVWGRKSRKPYGDSSESSLYGTSAHVDPADFPARLQWHHTEKALPISAVIPTSLENLSDQVFAPISNLDWSIGSWPTEMATKSRKHESYQWKGP